jgi:hypothetical protein
VRTTFGRSGACAARGASGQSRGLRRSGPARLAKRPSSTISPRAVFPNRRRHGDERRRASISPPFRVSGVDHRRPTPRGASAHVEVGLTARRRGRGGRTRALRDRAPDAPGRRSERRPFTPRRTAVRHGPVQPPGGRASRPRQRAASRQDQRHREIGRRRVGTPGVFVTTTPRAVSATSISHPDAGVGDDPKGRQELERRSLLATASLRPAATHRGGGAISSRRSPSAGGAAGREHPHRASIVARPLAPARRGERAPPTSAARRACERRRTTAQAHAPDRVENRSAFGSIPTRGRWRRSASHQDACASGGRSRRRSASAPRRGARHRGATRREDGPDDREAEHGGQHDPRRREQVTRGEGDVQSGLR